MMVVVIMVMMMCTDSIIPSRIYIHLAEKQITAVRLTGGDQEKEEFGVFSSLSLSFLSLPVFCPRLVILCHVQASSNNKQTVIGGKMHFN